MADVSSALRKLQSGQPLTDAEKKLLGISVTPAAPAATPKPTALQGLKNDSAATATPAPVVDEQTKIAGAAPVTPKFQSPVEAALGRDIGSSAATTETAAQRLERIRLEREKTQAGLNPDNPMPTEDPGEGMYWANFGGVWRKYKYVVAQSFGVNNAGGNNNAGNNNNAGGNDNAGNNNAGNNTTGAPTTNIDVLKAALRGMGFSSTIVEASTSFLNGLIRDGLDYDNATEIFLNSKEYTLKNGQKITSPFYTEYGYLNEGLTVPKTANELFNTVEGFKGVADKYKLSSKYLTQDALKAYIKNDVTVADLAERAGTAQLRALEADPFQVNALIKQGFISSAADLADFYLDPKIGKEQLELNRQTGVFTAEALRRAKSGISSSAAQLSGFKQLTATLSAKGYSEAQIAQLAGQGFENISETLMPTTQLAQIYEKAGGTVESNAALTESIQSSLLQEEFMGTASERRKRLSEQNVRAFQGSAGTTTGSLRQANVLGIL
jgi:hypothetical protein